MASSSTQVAQPISSHPTPSLRNEISVICELELDVTSCTPDGNTCWVGLYSDEIKLINQQGDQLLSVKLPHGADHTALTTKGELLVSGTNTTVITCVNKSGKTREFIDMSKFSKEVKHITGIVTTQRDDAIVTIRMSSKIDDKIIMISGRDKKITPIDHNFFNSFRLLSINTVAPDKFCVEDGAGKEGGAFVFLDGTGDMFKRLPRWTPDSQKYIRALTGDRYGNMITGGNRYVYVFNNEDQCKRTFRIPGAGWILGLAVDVDDFLWIGMDTKNLIIAKYLE